uniref:Fusaric acid resistance protein FusB n=1 Tax=Burkholderia cepacia TaxID=292 RepID=FUSB_BURCE|nr:RecName: Full=Fusaric acid resistance protein FusB [Burkholderia cepacia]AAC60389.1 FusB [Burkholderia cepacia]BAA02065.1 fusB [Burkholderia cepacia]
MSASSPLSPTAGGPFAAWYAAFGDWARTDGAAWLYLFKALLAAFIALGVSMRLDLPAPKTAMTTVFIVMQRKAAPCSRKASTGSPARSSGSSRRSRSSGCSRSSRSCSCWRSPCGSRCAPPAPRATATSAVTASCSPAIRPR